MLFYFLVYLLKCTSIPLRTLRLQADRFGILLTKHQAEMEAAYTKLQTTEQQLTHDREQHQRYMMEREADAKASAAAAMHEKTSELAAQREAQDRCRPKPALVHP